MDKIDLSHLVSLINPNDLCLVKAPPPNDFLIKSGSECGVSVGNMYLMAPEVCCKIDMPLLYSESNKTYDNTIIDTDYFEMPIHEGQMVIFYGKLAYPPPASASKSKWLYSNAIHIDSYSDFTDYKILRDESGYVFRIDLVFALNNKLLENFMMHKLKSTFCIPTS